MKHCLEPTRVPTLPGLRHRYLINPRHFPDPQADAVVCQPLDKASQIDGAASIAQTI